VHFEIQYAVAPNNGIEELYLPVDRIVCMEKCLCAIGYLKDYEIANESRGYVKIAPIFLEKYLIYLLHYDLPSLL